MKEKVVFNWSGGKDSAFALQKILASTQYQIESLLTTVSAQYQRISMHGVRIDLLDAQAESLGLPLMKVQIPDMPTMEVYEETIKQALQTLKDKGVTGSVFGDIFLEDLKKYREDKLSMLNMVGHFPLWKMNTKNLIHEFLDAGFKTITVCVNDKYLDKSFVGRIIDNDFIKDLPSNVDPCGEHGEFHTFVFDGPIFKKPINFEKGEIVYRKYSSSQSSENSSRDTKSYDCNTQADNPFDNGFWYCDLLLTPPLPTTAD